MIKDYNLLTNWVSKNNNIYTSSINKHNISQSLGYTILLNNDVKHPEFYLNKLENRYETNEKPTIINGTQEAFHILKNFLDQHTDPKPTQNTLQTQPQTQPQTTKKMIGILYDCDVDGLTSGTIMHKYLQINFPHILVKGYTHRRKIHGLEDDELQLWNDMPNLSLLIIPDASSDEEYYHNILKNNNTQIIVLDHHPTDNPSTSCTLVNNLTSDYQTKSLSGAGVVYKFLEYFEENYYQQNEPINPPNEPNNPNQPKLKIETLVDLAAIGILGDMMDLRETETKWIVDKGLSNIQNKYLLYLIKNFLLNKELTYTNIYFYLVPPLNAVIRRGSQEELQRIIGYFLGYNLTNVNLDKSINYIKESLQLQKELVKNSLEEYKEYIHPHCFTYQTNNKLLIIEADNLCHMNYNGLIANKIAEVTNSAVLMLSEKEAPPNTLRGSGRLPDNKVFLLKILKLYGTLKGHEKAFGYTIKKENINPLCQHIHFLNTAYQNRQQTNHNPAKHQPNQANPPHKVNPIIDTYDIIIDYKDLNIELIDELISLNYLYAKGVNQPKIIVTNCKWYKEFIKPLKNDTIKLLRSDRLFDTMRFKAYNSNIDLNKDYTGDFEVRFNNNLFNNIITRQMIITNDIL